MPHFNENDLHHENNRRADWRSKRIEALADQYQLTAVLARLRPKKPVYFAAVDAALLFQTGKALSSLSVASCNRGLTPRQETRRTNLAAKASEIAGWYGLTASAYGDPRGYVLRLHGGGLPQNGWGEGYGVA